MEDSFRIDPSQYRDVFNAASNAVSDGAHLGRAGVSGEDAVRLSDLFKKTDEEIEAEIAENPGIVEKALRVLVHSDYYQQSKAARDRVEKYQDDKATALFRSAQVHADVSPAGLSAVPEIGERDAKYRAQEIRNRAVEAMSSLPEEAVSFALEDVLSITPGFSGYYGVESRLIQLAKLLSGNPEFAIADMLKESDSLVQMVLAQYPELKDVKPLEKGDSDESAVHGWIKEQKAKFGRELFFVPKAIAEGAFQRRTALDEVAGALGAGWGFVSEGRPSSTLEPVDTFADIAKARELGESFKGSSKEKHEDILRELGMLMTYGKPDVREAATKAVGDSVADIQEKLIGNVVDHLILRLGDKELLVRKMAAYELGKCLKLIKDFERAGEYLAHAIAYLTARVLHDKSKFVRSAAAGALKDNFDLIPEGMRGDVARTLKAHEWTSYQGGEFRNRVIDQLDSMPAEAVAFNAFTIKALLSDDSKKHVESVYQLATHLLSVDKWNPSVEGQSVETVRAILFDQYPSVDWESLKKLKFFGSLMADKFYLLPKSFVASFDAKQAAALAGKTSGAVKKPTEEGFFGRRGGVGTDEGLAELRAAAAELVAPLMVEGRASGVEGKRSLVTLRRGSGQAGHWSLVGGGRGQRVAGSLSIVDGRRSIAQNPPSLRAKRSNPDASTVSPRPSTSLGARDDRQAVAKAIEVARRSEGLSDVAAYLEALDDRRRQSLHSRATYESRVTSHGSRAGARHDAPLSQVYMKLIRAGKGDLVRALQRMEGELSPEQRIILTAAVDMNNRGLLLVVADAVVPKSSSHQVIRSPGLVVGPAGPAHPIVNPVFVGR